MDDRTETGSHSPPAKGGEITASAAGAASEGFADLFEDTEEAKQDRDEVGQLHEMIKSLLASVSDLAAGLHACQEQLTDVRSELARLRTDDQVLNEMHERIRALTEEFHTQEVLAPVFRTLIGIADRCMQGSSKAAEVREAQAGSGNGAALRALEHIRQARDADRIEVENLLANLGVEPFENPSEDFDSALQRCVERVPTVDVSTRGQIARRILPGYRRNGRVVRQECVAVYVAADAVPTNEKGAVS